MQAKLLIIFTIPELFLSLRKFFVTTGTFPNVQDTNKEKDVLTASCISKKQIIF